MVYAIEKEGFILVFCGLGSEGAIIARLVQKNSTVRPLGWEFDSLRDNDHLKITNFTLVAS